MKPKKRSANGRIVSVEVRPQNRCAWFAERRAEPVADTVLVRGPAYGYDEAGFF